MTAGVGFLYPRRGFARAAVVCCLIAATGSSRCFADGASLSRVNVGAAAPLFSALGADGTRHRLSDYRGKIVVLEWTSPVCPYTAVKYRNGAMQALQSYAARHRVVWLSMDTAAPGRAGYLTPAAARQRITATRSVVTGFLFDVDGKIARRFGAKTTPSFFIVDRDGKLAYEGAMDDENSADSARPNNYVRDALEDLHAHVAVRTPETRPYGCGIEY
jgi:AhpC/TSA family